MVAHAIDPTSAVFARIERPAQHVRNVAGGDATRLHVPQFLDTDGIDLRVQAVEMEVIDEIFSQRAARAFCENRNFGVQLVARCEILFWFPAFVEALVVGDHACDAVAVVE